jgi:hypothetical protein
MRVFVLGAEAPRVAPAGGPALGSREAAIRKRV